MEWPSPIGVARISPAPRPCASRNASSGSSTSSGGRLLASPSAGVWTMSSAAIGALIRPQTYKHRNLLCAEVSQATMPRIRSLLLSLLTSALLAGVLAPGQALASHSQLTFFEGSSDLLEASTRPHAIAQLQALGVHALRVELYWEAVAPAASSASKPNFEATNPASYAWGQYDALLAEAKRLHWPVLLTVTAPAPRWATSNHTAPYVTRPDDQEFEEFMTAVGRHYARGGLAVLDLERGQPSRFPDAAVEVQRHARLAVHLPRALRGRLQRPAGRRDGPSADPLRRNRADGLRQGQRAQGRLKGDAASGRAAGVPARSALPEREIQESGLPAARCR